MVITKEFYNKRNLQEEENLSIVYAKVFDCLSNELITHNFLLTIVKKDKNMFKYHDRHIITDYLIIKSSNSISFFNKNDQVISPSTVTLEPKPHIAKNGSTTIGDNTIHFLKEIKSIVNSVSESNILGEKNLPILNHI